MFNIWFCQISHHAFEGVTHCETPHCELFCFFWELLFALSALRCSPLHSVLLIPLIIFQTERTSTRLAGWLTRCVLSVYPPHLHPPLPEFPPPAVQPRPLIMLLSLLIAFSHHPCPAAFSLFSFHHLKRWEQQCVFPPTKQEQKQDQPPYTLCSEQTHCDKKKKHLFMHWNGAQIQRWSNVWHVIHIVYHKRASDVQVGCMISTTDGEALLHIAYGKNTVCNWQFNFLKVSNICSLLPLTFWFFISALACSMPFKPSVLEKLPL